ncbi:MAG: acyltransferase family protein [Mycobacteriaceae bacterium]
MSPRRPHRVDLDGLRGVAITAVVVFHLWFGRVSGGVDVFLVLSGYFFIGSLLKIYLANQVPKPLPIIIRLARRLLPALITVITACVILAIVTQPQTRWEFISDQLLASLFYYQNWELAQTSSDYLAADQAVSPLQHLWSISVQGQFFICIVALTLGLSLLLNKAQPQLDAHAKCRVVAGVLAVCTTASFCYASYPSSIDQPWAYYDSFARAWELLTGGLLATLAPLIKLDYRFRNILSIVGITLILSCGIIIEGSQKFPGPLTLVPVLATSFLILSINSPNPSAANADPCPPVVSRLLAARHLVWLGSISYALYLWHWPLLISWLALKNQAKISVVQGTFILAAALALATLTTRYIENPIRNYHDKSPLHNNSRQNIFNPISLTQYCLCFFLLCTIVSSLSWNIYIASTIENRGKLAALSVADYPGAREFSDAATVPKLPMRPTALEAKDDVPITTLDGCIADFDTTEILTCQYGDINSPRTIALAGGSHSEHWITALDILGKNTDFPSEHI